MNPSPSLIAIALVVYLQSGMPGLGTFEFLLSLLVNHVTSPKSSGSGSEKSTTITESDGTKNNEEFRSPVNVNNDNVEEASVNIEINHHEHHHYHDGGGDDLEVLSDGGPEREDDRS